MGNEVPAVDTKKIVVATEASTKSVKPASAKKETPASIFIEKESTKKTETYYQEKSQLSEILGTGSLISLFAGGAAIFSSMLAKDAIKNPTIQTLLKNLPIVGKVMAIAGAIGLLVAFATNEKTPKLTNVETNTEKSKIPATFSEKKEAPTAKVEDKKATETKKNSAAAA